MKRVLIYRDAHNLNLAKKKVVLMHKVSLLKTCRVSIYYTTEPSSEITIREYSADKQKIVNFSISYS